MVRPIRILVKYHYGNAFPSTNGKAVSNLERKRSVRRRRGGEAAVSGGGEAAVSGGERPVPRRGGGLEWSESVLLF
jgi:hypothetical protein